MSNKQDSSSSYAVNSNQKNSLGFAKRLRHWYFHGFDECLLAYQRGPFLSYALLVIYYFQLTAFALGNYEISINQQSPLLDSAIIRFFQLFLVHRVFSNFFFTQNAVINGFMILVLIKHLNMLVALLADFYLSQRDNKLSGDQKDSLYRKSEENITSESGQL